MTKNFCKLGAMIVVLASLTGVGAAQQVDHEKVQSLAEAIAKAEGFGVKGAIPTRYHNPGNIRSTKTGHHYDGQIGLNRCGYVIFKSDRYGWRALREQLELMASGQSAHYGTDMTILSVAKIYATGWRLWAKNVSKGLGVSPATTLKEYFTVTAPKIVLPGDMSRETLIAILGPSPMQLPVLAE